MAKHTPGPWEIGHLGEDGSFEIGTSYQHRDGLYQIVGPTGMVIAARNQLLLKAEESRANARLIAAAPDLLEAAKHVAMEWRLHGQLTDSCRVLEAAIAKATGVDR